MQATLFRPEGHVTHFLYTYVPPRHRWNRPNWAITGNNDRAASMLAIEQGHTDIAKKVLRMCPMSCFRPSCPVSTDDPIR